MVLTEVTGVDCVDDVEVIEVDIGVVAEVVVEAAPEEAAKEEVKEEIAEETKE